MRDSASASGEKHSVVSWVETTFSTLLKGQTVRQWFVEFMRFCTVGLGSYIVDVGIFNLLAYYWNIPLPGDRSMSAKVISVSIAIVFSWVMNRVWTFGDSRTNNRGREFVLFVAVNIGGMLIALGCLGVSRYILDMRTQFADNISANVVGLVLGTIFRYIMYRYVIFTGSDSKNAS